MDYSSQPQTQVVRTHGNGHIPGSRLASTDTVTENRHSVGLYEMDAVTPMLEHLPENANSDSKGGGNGSMILTPNGAKLNGFVPLLKNGLRNGQLTNPNGQMGHVADHYRDGVMDVEETRGLIAAMLRGGDDHCIGAEDSFDVTRSGDLGSLDDIDHSHENMADPTLTKSQDSSLSEKSSSGGSDSVGMERNSDSLPYCSYSGGTMPRSDTTDTGDTVIFRASVGSGDRSMSSASGGESETACVLGEHLSGTTIPRSLSEAGHAVGDAERNCHDTNNIRDTHRQETPSALSGAALPQYQLSTSNQPQVLGSACVDRNASSRCPDSRSDHRSERAVLHDAGSNYDGGGGGNSHVHSNGEPRWGRNRAAPSQGDADLSPVRAAYNPTIPHAPSREITPVQQSGDVTLAEIPQDVLKGKASSRQRPNHFKV